ncbi:DUF4189 domain-containing protein (plasmid) [Rhizobium sp. NIBRBAC000502774]|nr:DUF4189 domain-containing protein [Rhizobium sp. NIBRBAC000502774]
MKVFISGGGLGVAAVLATCCFLPTGPAYAQAPCTGAPGERVVGMTQGNPAMAPMPLCVYDADPNAAPAPSRANQTYAAIAWHTDASDIWIEGNYDGPSTAEEVALEACNRAMGGGCTSAGEWSNSSVAVIQDASGHFRTAWLGDGGGQRQQVLDKCSSEQLLPCEVFMTVKARFDRHWPGPEARVAYAAAAWVNGDGYDHKLYIASGYRTGEEASTLALAACHAANPQHQCEITARIGGGFIQTGSVGVEEFALIETSERRARRAAERRCRQGDEPKACRIQAVFSSRVHGQFVHDFRASVGR